MTMSLFIKQFELPCFSSYIIKTMKEFKFFPREKDKKPEINEPVENVSDIDVGDIKEDVEKSQKKNNNWKKKTFNSEK